MRLSRAIIGEQCLRPSGAPRRLWRSRPCSAAVQDGPIVWNSQVQRLHTATHEQIECMKSLEGFFESEILPLLSAVDENWQPADVLPDPRGESFLEDIRDLQARSSDIPDDLLVCLVGDMVTEEALPTYMNMLNTLDGFRDETGSDQHAYARWTRQWTAEENRHGDVLNKYLWLTGKVDMKSVERTIQHLIGQGMVIHTENHPYKCMIYTSFQERATKFSHGATARLAKEKGDDVLAKICGLIAADESRHEMAYTRTVDAIFKRDPQGAVSSFADMMRQNIIMPAHFMDDGQHRVVNGMDRGLFDDFSTVTEDLGVYTAIDYIDIMQHLITRWDVANLNGLDDQGVKDQEFLLSLPERFTKLAERKSMRKQSKRSTDRRVKFSWIFNRDIPVV